MGYRFYLYTIDKSEIEKAKSKTYKELSKEYGDVSEYDGEKEYYFSPYNFKTVKKIHELGKYLDEKLYNGLIDNSLGIILENEEVKEKITQEHDFGFLDANGFKKFLEVYTSKVLDVLKKQTLDDKFEKANTKLKESVEEKIRWIEHNCTYDLNLDNENIQNSWLYEYVIFDLIHYYKIINWDKQYVMFYAY